MDPTRQSFLEILSDYRSLVWPRIETYLRQNMDFPSYCQVAQKYSDLLSFHDTLVSEYPSRLGKYLRPFLVMCTAGAMGVSKDISLQTAAAMQMSEDWILNHDDIEDDSLERRGKPALHRLYGRELATNAGDALHVLMWKTLRDNESIIGPAKTFEIIDEFYRMLNRTVFGQTVDIKWTQENRLDLSLPDLLLVLESKTGYYTIAGPMRLGGILAGASESELNHLYQFGKYLGFSFQITDDLLDLVSDFNGLKKQRGNDIFEGKRTVMLIHLLENCTPAQKKALLEILSKTREEKTQAEVDCVIDMMKSVGSLEYAAKLSGDYIQKATDYFNKNLGFLNIEHFRLELLGFINFLAHRDH